MLTAHSIAFAERDRPARALPPEAGALLEVPAGYGGYGAWLDERAAPQLARLLARCNHEVAMAIGAGRTCEAIHLLCDGAPGTPGTAQRDRFAAGLFDGAGRMNAFVEVVRDHPGPGTLCISALFIDPDLRGCGVAGQAVEAIERWARAEGARVLHMLVPRRNAGAVAFALRSGFARVGDARVGGASGEARLAVMSRRVAEDESE